MTFQTKIQTFAGAHTPQGFQDQQCAVDWTRGKVFIGSYTGNPSTGYLTRSNVVSGAEEAFTLLSAYDGAHIQGLAPPIGLNQAGDVYLGFPSGTQRVSGVNFAQLAVFGNVGSPTLPFGYNAGKINRLSNINVGLTDYMIAAVGGGGGAGQTNVYMQKDVNFFGLNNATAGTGQSFCRGRPGSGLIYAIGSNSAPFDGNPNTFYKYAFTNGSSWIPSDWPTTNPNLSITTIATFNPSDIDPGWTKCTIGGMCVDETDGNVIFYASGSVGSNSHYVVKINAATGAIIWTSPLPTGATSIAQLQQSRIRHQKLCVWTGSPNTITTINTADGSSTSYTSNLGGLVTADSQCFDDTSGILLCQLNWVGGVDTPIGLNGSSPPFAGWAALYVAEAIHEASGRRFLAELGPVRL